MHTFKIWTLATILIGLLSCKDEEKIPDLTVDGTVSTFYFIRHAEKDRSNPENADPELNQKGMGRAMHWTEILNDVPLDAIYSTNYERTAMTAAPTAIKRNITVQYYTPEEVNIEQFKADNLGKNVLVVGHSNSTPDFVNKIIGEEKYFSLDDADNGSLFIVNIIGNQASSQRLQFNCNCPER